MSLQNNYGLNLLCNLTDVQTLSTTVTATREVFIRCNQFNNSFKHKRNTNDLATQINTVNNTINSNTTTVNNNLSSKANSSDVSSQINSVNSNLALKANSCD